MTHDYTNRYKAAMSPGVVTPKEDRLLLDLQPTSVRLPTGMIAEIDEVASATDRKRNETIALLLRFALDAHWNGTGRKAKKRRT